MGLLDGKTLLVTGVLTDGSIASRIWSAPTSLKSAKRG